MNELSSENTLTVPSREKPEWLYKNLYSWSLCFGFGQHSRCPLSFTMDCDQALIPIPCRFLIVCHVPDPARLLLAVVAVAPGLRRPLRCASAGR